ACSPGSSNVYVGSPCAFGAGAGGVPGVADGCFSMTDGGGGGGFGASGRARGSSTTRLSGGGSAGARAIPGRRPERRVSPAAPRGVRGRLSIDDGAIHLSRPGLRVDVPAHAVTGVVPWRIPLPGPGFSFRMASGSRLPHGVQLHDPAAALQLLAERGGIEAAK